ncbi:hypothetical protein J2X03_003816 [Microbacterium trichothecenolyticum]|uniref:hypothetical protein n=1 Tax=Microbacterium trichothecenolyticum TaxID=69370 RepID=UPI00285AE129|nr:hypothetical protein [Microbacterium trichothecenolyticum]MDR7113914.1 hypothetical protein [Microbacterium trichothecenolyticum]
MTLTTPLMTLPPRTLAEKGGTWRIDDTVISGATRWIIRRLDPRTGAVELEVANTTNAGMWWRTTVDMLGEKRA